MSPRAAWRLEQLQFEQVYDYVLGKTAWMASGRHVEGSLGDDQRVGALVQPLPTCRVDDEVGGVDLGTEPLAVVLDDGGVLMGTVSAKVVASALPATLVEDVMTTGPSTFRPSLPIHEAFHHVEEHGVPRLLITTLDGHWVGVVTRDALAPTATPRS
ncbi:MAG: domain containing protein [Acidimicrobiales bacterium]|nr:domain containing protein [Acidimicrobiales bacterium]